MVKKKRKGQAISKQYQSKIQKKKAKKQETGQDQQTRKSNMEILLLKYESDMCALNNLSVHE